ncbi:MAG: RluA family pseudouridine synthase [Deltaproteobacteria bacterium]|nr:RluA family pseudouridine synthase [Deltaproteobacteria bacterium]
MVDQVAGAKTISWKVPTEPEAVRLDAFVRRCLPHLSRREVDKAITDKLFVVNGRVGKKGQRLTSGADVVFTGPVNWLAERPQPAAEFDIPIIYQDAALIALDKRAGVATHGFSARDGITAANFIATRWPELLQVGKSRWEPGLVHRLDIETSGLLLAAKTNAAFDHLRDQFRRREIGKTYWALVWGETDGAGEIALPLAHDSRDRRRMRVAEATKNAAHQRVWPALTRYRKLGFAQGVSLLEIEMATGVTHQIRVHLAALGHAIIGDGLYGAAHDERFGLQRHFLHAMGLEFNHPTDGHMLKLTAPLAPELAEVLRRLGINYSAARL